MSGLRTQVACHASIRNEQNNRAIAGDFSVTPIDAAAAVQSADARRWTDFMLICLWAEIACLVAWLIWAHVQ